MKVLKDLIRLRELCEGPLSERFLALFRQAQEQKEIKSALAGCRDKPFWRWASVSSMEIFTGLELQRKWGMICSHPECEDLRKQSNYKKHIRCDGTV